MLSERIVISFNEKQAELLREESEKLGSSIASIVRMAIRDYFSNKGVNYET